VYFIFDIASFDISSNCRHFNGSPLLCPINATSSFSYVFTLHYPRVLHCRIVPIQKLKTVFVLGRKKPPIIVVLSEFKRSNLKVTRKFAKTPCGHVDRGGEYFHETFVKIFTPLSSSPRGVFANLRVTFKLLLLNSDRTTIMGGFTLPSTNNFFNFWIETILQ
jgi:hypothetical protein